MATYSWYGGNTVFKDTIGGGQNTYGVLRFNNDELTSGNLGTQLFFGFNLSNGTPYPVNFDGYFSQGYDSTKFSCDTTGCSWGMYGVNDDTAMQISYSLSQNNTGSSRTIAFKYDDKTIFSIIQSAYSSGSGTTMKTTYTINAIKFNIKEHALFLQSSLSNYLFTCSNTPLMAENDNDEYFAYWVTNSSSSFSLGHIVANSSFRNDYNMTYVSGNKTYFNFTTINYYNYTNVTVNVLNTLTMKVTNQKATISDNIAVCSVTTSKTCTIENNIQFNNPDFVFKITM